MYSLECIELVGWDYKIEFTNNASQYGQLLPSNVSEGSACYNSHVGCQQIPSPRRLLNRKWDIAPQPFST